MGNTWLDFRGLFFADVAFDSFKYAEGHRGRGAADAGAVEADADDALGRNIDEFNVAAVGLNYRAKPVNDQLYAVLDRGLHSGGVIGLGGGGHSRLLEGNPV